MSLVLSEECCVEALRIIKEVSYFSDQNHSLKSRVLLQRQKRIVNYYVKKLVKESQ